MEINIALPECSSVNTYKELKGYLKQLELAVHHAQKAVESAEESGFVISEDAYVNFSHPALESSLRLDEQKKEIPITSDNFIDFYYEELQNIELHINLN